MTPLVASTTIQSLADSGSNVFNSIITAWMQLLSNTTLIVAVVGFAVVGYVLGYIKRKVF